MERRIIMERVNIMANCLTELIFQQALEGFTGVNDIGVNLSECGVRAGVLLVVPMMPLSKAALRGGFFFEPVVIRGVGSGGLPAVLPVEMEVSLAVSGSMLLIRIAVLRLGRRNPSRMTPVPC